MCWNGQTVRKHLDTATEACISYFAPRLLLLVIAALLALIAVLPPMLTAIIAAVIAGIALLKQKKTFFEST